MSSNVGVIVVVIFLVIVAGMMALQLTARIYGHGGPAQDFCEDQNGLFKSTGVMDYCRTPNAKGSYQDNVIQSKPDGSFYLVVRYG